MSSTVANPLIGASNVDVAEMAVPRSSGLNVFLIQIGMPRVIAGNIVFGWITLAPKYASSDAS